MAEVVHVGAADHGAYLRVLLAAPFTGEVTADVPGLVYDHDDRVNLVDGQRYHRGDPVNAVTIQMHGTDRFTVPDAVTTLHFSDGTSFAVKAAS